MFITIVVVLFLSLVYNLLPENVQEKIRNWVKDTLKWAAVCGIAIGILYAAIIFLPGALAEEDDTYLKVAFIDTVEEADGRLLIHADDLDHIWDYWEDEEEEEEDFSRYEFDKEMSNMSLWFVLENRLYAEFDKEEKITRGRIVVLVMRPSNDPNGDEVMDVYYSELVTCKEA